ncbi:MAG: hypothetical protein QXO33_04445 [Nitrososphaeria archaeon]
MPQTEYIIILYGRLIKDSTFWRWDTGASQFIPEEGRGKVLDFQSLKPPIYDIIPMDNVYVRIKNNVVWHK